MKYLFLLCVLISCNQVQHPCEKLLNKGNTIQFNIESGYLNQTKSETLIIPPSKSELIIVDSPTVQRVYPWITLRYTVENSNSVETVNKDYENVWVFNCQVVK